MPHINFSGGSLVSSFGNYCFAVNLNYVYHKTLKNLPFLFKAVSFVGDTGSMFRTEGTLGTA